MTKAELFDREEYIGVKLSMKVAKKTLREMFPYMREKNGHMSSDPDNMYTLFIHEEEV